MGEVVALRQLVVLKEEKVRKAEQSLRIEICALSAAEKELHVQKALHDKLMVSTKAQGQAWFAEAATSPLTAKALEQMLAKIAVLREQMTAQGQKVLQQEETINRYLNRVSTARTTLVKVRTEAAKMENLLEQQVAAQKKRSDKVEEAEMEEVPFRSQETFQ